LVGALFVGLFRGLWGLGWPWRVWVGLLILLNGIVALPVDVVRYALGERKPSLTLEDLE